MIYGRRSLSTRLQGLLTQQLEQLDYVCGMDLGDAIDEHRETNHVFNHVCRGTLDALS